MTTSRFVDSRVRAYVQFLAALFYYFLARVLARHGALGISSEGWAPVVEQAMLVFLLLLGFAGFGFTLNRQMNPLTAQGLPRRQGWPGEVALGLAVGWAAVLVCALVLALAGGIAIRFQGNFAAWRWFAVDALFFALFAMAEEIAFRGYAFQRFARALGPVGAVLGFTALYAFLQALLPGSSRASTAVAIVFNLVLSIAYLRTRALWVSWGINFGWKATRALLFGLAVSGINSQSPVVQGDPMGPFWLTGGGYGLDASWLAFFVLLLTVPVVYLTTRDLDYRYNTPEIIPAGIPVDLDAAARQQHEAAIGPVEPTAPVLVQIAPLGSTFLPTVPGQSSLEPPDPLQNPEAPRTIAGNETH
jgi:membrane protease YdiL (CAAX protease family)